MYTQNLLVIENIIIAQFLFARNNDNDFILSLVDGGSN